jgi:Ca2+-binding RTX toxin-like protein
MGVIRLTSRPRTTRGRVAVLAALFLMAFSAQLLLAGPAGAGALTGGFSPTVINGGADLNGSGVVNGRDDANEFYVDTSIIDGKLDCDTWGAQANAGTAGDLAITGADNCSLVGYDGTGDGVTINVVAGAFDWPNGPLPTVFNALDPGNPDIGDSDFAWSAIDGRVDSNGNEVIDGDDCHFGIVGRANDSGILPDPTEGVDILGNPGANQCGFGTPPNTADNGLVDLNSDADITGADSCSNRCFFGHNVVLGKVQELECPGYEGDPRNDVVGTAASETLVGTAGADIICGRAGNDTLIGRGGRDLLLGGRGADLLRGGARADTLRGGPGRDLLLGGRGADLLRGGARADTLRGGRGRDVLRGDRGPDRLFGGPRGDALFGGRGSDFMNGGSGFDSCVGGPGIDVSVRCETH